MKEIRNVRPFGPPRGEEGIEGLSAFASAPAEVPPGFVSSVMRGLPASAGRDRRRPSEWKWAAALLIFSAAAGYSFSIAEQTSDSVDSLTSTSPDAVSGVLIGP